MAGNVTVWATAALVAALAFLAAGCASTADEEVASSSGLAQPMLGAPRNTGEFPNLNIPPRVAAPQFSDEESAAKLAALEAERTASQSGPDAGSASARAARLRKLAEEHAEETLEEIEAD